MPDTSTEPIDLNASAEALLDQARRDTAGRAEQALIPGEGARLNQQLVALVGGQVMEEHENPGMTTVQVLRGRVRLLAGDHHVELVGGGYTPVPPTRHSVDAIDDSALVITVSSDAAADSA